MDPENLRTVIVALVGLVPAWLLYLQNKRSSEREAKERAEIRAAESAKELASKSAADAAAKAAFREAQLQKILAFGGVADKVATQLFVISPHDRTVYTLPAEDRQELAHSYMDIQLSGMKGIQEEAEEVYDALMDIIVYCATFAGSPDQSFEDRFKNALRNFRATARNVVDQLD